MMTVLRAHGPWVVIYLDDHEPVHVHVFGDGQVKIDLVGTRGSPVLVSADGMKATRSGVRRRLSPTITTACSNGGRTSGIDPVWWVNPTDNRDWDETAAGSAESAANHPKIERRLAEKPVQNTAQKLIPTVAPMPIKTAR